MKFLADNRLWLLAALVPLAAIYLLLQRRRRHTAVRFANLKLLSTVAPRGASWRRHVPAAAAALAMVALVVGLARPVVDRRVPKQAATIMLAVDTSASMEATDVDPSRIEAATKAAKEFIEGLPKSFQVGLVSFDRTARVLATPTDDHDAVEQALTKLTTGAGTATGEGIYASLEAIAASGAPPTKDGSSTAAIVLLSDGVTTVGRPIEEAASAAADEKIPVTTIAFGTSSGTVMVQGRPVAVPADPESMSQVASDTGGSFFEAFSAEELKSVYDDIGSRVGYEIEQHEITMAVILAGTIFLMVALVTGHLWAPRML